MNIKDTRHFMAYIDVSIAKSRFRPLPLPCAMALLHPEEENVVFSSLEYMRLHACWRGNNNGERRREGKIGNCMQAP